MRRLMMGIVVVGIVLGAGVSSAQQSGPPMPEKVRAFLDKMTGTWEYRAGEEAGRVDYRWNAGRSAVVGDASYEKAEMSGSGTEMFHWDGTSQDGIVVSMSYVDDEGLYHAQIYGSVLSESRMTGRRTAVAAGQKAACDVQLMFEGPDRFVWRDTDRVLGEEEQPDLVAVHTRIRASSDEQELIRVQQEWSRAEVAGDVRTVDRILADEYVLTLSDGTLMPKAAYLRDVQSEDTRSIAMTVEGTKVQLYGDMALVKGIVKWTEPGGEKHENLFSETWLKRDGRWQCLATHESAIEPTIDNDKLSDEMKKLAVWVGKWQYEGEQVDPPVAGLPYGGAGTFSGTIAHRFVLGGRFLEGRTEDHNPAGTTTGVELEGYDPKAGNYVSSAFGSEGAMSTSLQTVSPDGRTWTTRSTMTTSAGDKVPVRSVTTFSPDGMRYTGTTEVSPDGGQTWKHWYSVKGTKARD